jgi:hypothetical protein
LYSNEVAELVMSASQDAAPAGIAPGVEVVVWLPALHTHRMVSPTLTFTLAGLKKKLPTITTCFTAKAGVCIAIPAIMARFNRIYVIFFIGAVLNII